MYKIYQVNGTMLSVYVNNHSFSNIEIPLSKSSNYVIGEHRKFICMKFERYLTTMNDNNEISVVQ